MKLATRYQRTNMAVTLVLFLLAGLGFYGLLNRVLIFQVDEDLKIEQREIEAYNKRYGTLPQNVTPVEDQKIQFEKTALVLPKPAYRTVLLMDEVEQDKVNFRQLAFTLQVQGQWYKITVCKSLESMEGLAHMIGLIALATIALMLFVAIIINRFVLRRLWKPFYKTIERMQAFELDKNDRLSLPHVPVEEFALLNKTLETATGKASQDYHILKAFIENASHELQTPLAIIHSKLDLLIQDEDLSERQSSLIHGAYDAIRRMTHLNQSLLMLAKIEGGQYVGRTSINITGLLREKLAMFDAFLQDKKLRIAHSLQPANLFMNAALADMLLNNLLSNALHHNTPGGMIQIVLTDHHLTVCNTSENPALPPHALFTRFYKNAEGPTHTGLGLAIAKQVCDASGCSITYHYSEDALHCFKVNWAVGKALP